MRSFTRLAALVALLFALGRPVAAEAAEGDALRYLEGLNGKVENYIAPSQIDRRYNIAFYVNAAGSGANAQRMWVMQRDVVTGEWHLAMWDEDWWAGTGASKYDVADGDTPPFSWLVSTGRYWRGDRKSGPTSTGVFALDERKWRSQKGWHKRGMIHVMYIDYHYSSGRRSGVAFHGTTPGQYRRLGRIASHGCVRMHQRNALAILKRIKGWDGVLSADQRWGEVPRFWRREKYANRYGYVRDGSLLPADTAENTAASAGDREVLDDAVKELPVLTKTGFRSLAVIFKD